MPNMTGSHDHVRNQQASAGSTEAPGAKAQTVGFFFARQPIVCRFWQSLQPSLRGAVSNPK